MKWSIPIALLVIVFLLLLGSPFLHISFAAADERILPLDSSARLVIEDMRQNFPGQDTSQITIAIQTKGDALSSGNLKSLDSYVQRLQKLPHVSNVQSAVSLAPGMSLAQYQEIYAHPAASPQLASAVKQFAKGDVEQVIMTLALDPHASEVKTIVHDTRAITAPAGMHIMVGGDAAQDIDQWASMSATIPYALMVMAIAIFVLLFLMTGSLIMPIKAIILNTLSLTASFGALVWIFQDGHFQNLLHFKAFGAIDSTQIVLIFAIAFGLSMDYEVFLMSRIKEQFDRTGDNRESVAVGLQRTGWLITSAALLLAVVVIAFASSHILEIQEIGVGLALAVLMDATLVRALLVPAMMNMLGKINWWAPRPLQWLWQRIGLREHVDDTSTEDVIPSAEREEEIVRA
jgi:RND superfamily putative drug exporter